MRVRLVLSILVTMVVACGGKARSLLLVDLQLGGGVSGVEHVEVVVSRDADELARKRFAWAPSAGSAVMGVGVYLPASVEGAVDVHAVAGGAGGGELARSSKQQVTVVAGKATEPVVLRLERGSVPADAGAPPDAAAPRPDGSAPDAPAPDAALAAERPADAAAPDTARDLPPDSSPDAAPAARRWGAAENIENDLVRRSYNPQIAVDPARGHVLVVWEEETTVKVRRLDAATGQWGEVKTLEDRGTIERAVVGMGEGGHAMVMWYQRSSAVGPELIGLWSSHSRDGGLTWSPPVRVHDKPVYEVAMVMSRAGDVRAAWEVAPGDNTQALWSGQWRPATAAWTDVAVVKPATDSDDRDPVMAVDRAGNGILAFAQEDAQGQDSVWASTFAPGQPPSAPVLIENHTTESAWYPSVAMHPEGGRGVVAFTLRQSFQVNEVFVNEWVAGSGWRGPQRAVGSTYATWTAVAMDRAGDLTVAWSQSLASGFHNVMAARRVGGAWGAAEPLETTNFAPNTIYDMGIPVMAVDGAGNVHVVWKRKMNMGTLMAEPTYGVIARRFAAATRAWEPEVVLGTRMRLRAAFPALAVADDGRAAVTWHYSDPSMSSAPEAFNVFVALYR